MTRPAELTALSAIAQLRDEVAALTKNVELLKRDVAHRDAQLAATQEGFTKAVLQLTDAVAARCLESDSYSVQAREELRRQHETIKLLPEKTATSVAAAVGSLLRITQDRTA